MYTNVGVMVGPAIGEVERRADVAEHGPIVRDSQGRCCRTNDGGFTRVCASCELLEKQSRARTDAAPLGPTAAIMARHGPSARPVPAGQGGSLYARAVQRSDVARAEYLEHRADSEDPPAIRPLSLFEIAKLRTSGGR